MQQWLVVACKFLHPCFADSVNKRENQKPEKEGNRDSLPCISTSSLVSRHKRPIGLHSLIVSVITCNFETQTRASYSSWLVVSAADCIPKQGCQVANIDTFANSKNCAWFLDGIWNGGFPVCESEMEGESSTWGLTCCVRFIFLKSSHVRPDTASLSLDSRIASHSAWIFDDLHWGWFLITDVFWQIALNHVVNFLYNDASWWWAKRRRRSKSAFLFLWVPGAQPRPLDSRRCTWQQTA